MERGAMELLTKLDYRQVAPAFFCLIAVSLMLAFIWTRRKRQSDKTKSKVKKTESKPRTRSQKRETLAQGDAAGKDTDEEEETVQLSVGRKRRTSWSRERCLDSPGRLRRLAALQTGEESSQGSDRSADEEETRPRRTARSRKVRA